MYMILETPEILRFLRHVQVVFITVIFTNGHRLMASTLVSYPHGVRLSQITSLQLPWHCKRYMSIGHI